MFTSKLLKGAALGTALFFHMTYLNAESKPAEAWSWGFGRNGELGIGSESNISLPQLIKNVSFVDIDSKKSMSAGITSQGKLMTWGKNRNGVLGHLPPNLNVLIPRIVEFKDKVVQVSCGYQHLCVVTDQGEAYVWGLDNKKSKFRSIGTSESEKSELSNLPTKVNLSNVRSASCANDYITFVDKQGKVFVLGDTKVKGANGSKAASKAELVELELENIVKVTSGINFSMALNDQGKVYVWGNNVYGQLGTGGLQNAMEPVLVEPLVRERVVDISCGDNYSGVVTEKGEVYTWGFGNEGQLGHGDKSDQFLPRRVVHLDHRIRQISCGGAHTALLSEAGKLLMVGRGREGQLGRQQNDESNSGYTLSVRQVEQLPQKGKIRKVACGATHTLILFDNIV